MCQWHAKILKWGFQVGHAYLPFSPDSQKASGKHLGSAALFAGQYISSDTCDKAPGPGRGEGKCNEAITLCMVESQTYDQPLSTNAAPLCSMSWEWTIWGCGLKGSCIRAAERKKGAEDDLDGS